MIGSEPPYGGDGAAAGEHLRAAGLRSRGAACGRNSRGGAGAAVQICKRATTRAAYLGNGNPEGLDIKSKNQQAKTKNKRLKDLA